MDEMKFVLYNYKDIIDKYLNTKDLAVSFFASSEEYADLAYAIIDRGINYNYPNFDFNVTFFQDFSFESKMLTDVNLLKIGPYSFLKVISPFTRERSYDLIITKRDEMKDIIALLNEKQQVSKFKKIDFPIIGVDFSILRENTIDFLLNEEFRDFCKKHRIPLKRGVVLEGFPGTGKTMSLKWLKEQAIKHGLGFKNFKSIGEFVEERDLYFGEEKKIFVFEDFDTALLEREKTGQTPSQILGMILNTLEGLDDIHDTVSVFTTNHIKNFDSALLRPGRIDKIITYHLPNKEQAIEFFKCYIPDISKYYEKMASYLMNLNGMVSYAILKGICDDINIYIFNKGKISYEAIHEIMENKVSSSVKGSAVNESSSYIL